MGRPARLGFARRPVDDFGEVLLGHAVEHTIADAPGICQRQSAHAQATTRQSEVKIRIAAQSRERVADDIGRLQLVP